MFPKKMNRRIGRAMHDYAMLNEGDSVLIAVSGGMDSLLLARLLFFWLKKAPINYSMTAVHIDMEGEGERKGNAANQLRLYFDELGVALQVLPAAWKPSTDQLQRGDKKDVCFQCARSRRTQLFEYARLHGFNKLALGHHRDDIIETFFINLTCAGNISTMRPKQELFSGRLSIIRPMAYCDKDEIDALGKELGIEPIPSSCPLSEQTGREEINRVLASVYRQLPDAKEHIFAALGNVREDYLLMPTSKRP